MFQKTKVLLGEVGWAEVKTHLKMKLKVLGRAEFTLGFQTWKMLIQKGQKQKLYMDTLRSLRMEDLEKTGVISVANYNYAIEDGNHG